MTPNKGVKQRVGIDVTVAEKWEGDLRTGGSLGGSKSPIWKLPGCLRMEINLDLGLFTMTYGELRKDKTLGILLSLAI